jgi:hypothetical protein
MPCSKATVPRPTGSHQSELRSGASQQWIAVMTANAANNKQELQSA